MIRDIDEDIQETAKELELNLHGEEIKPPLQEKERSALDFEERLADEEAGDAADISEEELEGIPEEDFDIIAEIGQRNAALSPLDEEENISDDFQEDDDFGDDK
jgi:DNA-directed RNA polymerase subunit beta